MIRRQKVKKFVKKKLNQQLKTSMHLPSRLDGRTGLSPRKLYMMRRFLRRLRWWGPRCPVAYDVDKIRKNRHIIRALITPTAEKASPTS